MKVRSLILTLAAALWSLCALAQEAPANFQCQVGFSYQLSYQNNWGSSSAVIVTVRPNSPASRAGLKVGDIIETIEGQKTTELQEETINSLLTRPDRSSVNLMVTNFGYKSKPVTLHKVCRPIDALSEDNLAEAFAWYSLEDVTDRRIVMPFVYTAPSRKDFFAYKTFSMYPISGQYTPMDDVINGTIIAALKEKGLEYKAQGGDLLVRTSYKLDNNPIYRSGHQSDPNFKNYRFDSSAGLIKEFPFASLSSPDYEGKFILELGIDLIDAKDKITVWEIKAKDRLHESFGVDRYAKAFVPQMFMNFPFQRYIKNPVYVLHRKSYLYTGISYDAKNMKNIYFVDPESPAAAAGIRAGDIVESINGIKMNRSSEALTDAYKRFITASFDYRDPSTLFVNDMGFRRNMYWDKTKYPQINELVHRGEFLPVFSYLFSHRPYIYNPPIKELVFEIKRDGKKQALIVRPQLMKGDYLELK